MINEAIILAGGIGSRLQSAVNDRPKSLALINAVPFLFYLVEYLRTQKIEHFIFSLGYKHEMVVEFLEKNYPKLSYELSVEQNPLGTGGAISLACKKATTENVIICNGDTLFKTDCFALSEFHEEKNASCTVCLKPMQNFDRYGSVELGDNNHIIAFEEKQFCNDGLINGGVYALNAKSFLENDLPEKFSFETDFLEKQTTNIFGLIQNEFFIDIGIPSDYQRAQSEKELLEILEK